MKKRFMAMMLAAVCAVTAVAADFIDTTKSPKLLTYGARIGINTSNRTMSDDTYPGCYHRESWGTGFDLGGVVNLNFRDWFAIQPGLFFDARYSHYTLMGNPVLSEIVPGGSETAQAGNVASYNFTIPVLANFRFNLTKSLRWSAEVGPYVAFVVGQSVRTRAIVSQDEMAIPLPMTTPSSVDFGFKIGTGLQLHRTWYAGVHYMAGCVHAWKAYHTGSLSKPFGGVTKAWMFTVGYDF